MKSLKSIYKILLVILLIGTFSCETTSELLGELSATDEIAVEGMEEAFEMALIYNDSLAWCGDSNNTCDVATISGYDVMFHENDDLYDMHHNNYSHNNIDDDHHHQAVSQHHHGDVEHEEGEEEHHGHSIESHQEMLNLREMHKVYHPN